MKTISLVSVLGAIVMTAACQAVKATDDSLPDKPDDRESQITPADDPTEEDVTVKLNTLESFQSWDGFGAMNLGSNWKLNTDWSDEDSEILLGDMGLSIMRICIPHDESRWEAIAADCAAIYDKYGVKILATPWTMPVSMKTPEQVEAKKDGVTSSLKPEKYKEYAQYLERFAVFMKEHGAPLEAISVQNEPDYAAEYDGCIWSAAQHLAFVRDYGQLIKSARLVTAESFSSRQEFYNHVLEDELACSHIDIVGGHLYGTEPEAYPLAVEKRKRLWMTEHLLNASWNDGGDHWAETMEMMKEIRNCLECGWNAYIWWYGCRYYSLAGDGENGTKRGEILPRGYAYAQYSKYIRPGDVRVGNTVEGMETLLCTAFKDECGKVKTVLVNIDGTRKRVHLDAGIDIRRMQGTCTSESLNVAALQVTPDSSSEVSFSMPARSIATIIVE